jgi:hypothetical protein
MSTQEARRTQRPPFWRRKRLIKPSMQLRLIITFAALFGSVFLFQLLVLNWQLAELGVERFETLPSSVVAEVVGNMQWIAFVVSLPATLIAGVLITHRWAGPVHQFEQYLGAIARGEDPGPCRIRKGDEMQELCVRLNAAVAALRNGAPARSNANAPGSPEAASEQAESAPALPARAASSNVHVVRD